MLLVVAIFALLVALTTTAVRSDRRVRLAHAVLYIVGLVATHQATLRVSKLALDAMLRQAEQLSTLAMIVSLELLLTVAVVTYRPARRPLRTIYHREGLVVAVMTACHQIAVWLPSLLMLPALCYLRSFVIYSIPGVHYWAVTITFAVVLLLLIELTPRLIRDREFLRLLAMLLAGVLAVGSVVAYTLLSGVTTVQEVQLDSSSPRELCILLATLAGGVLVGYVAMLIKAKGSRK